MKVIKISFSIFFFFFMALFAYANLRPLKISEQIEQTDFLIFEIFDGDSATISNLSIEKLSGVKYYKLSAKSFVLSVDSKIIQEEEIENLLQKSGIKSAKSLFNTQSENSTNHSFIKTKAVIIEFINALRLN